MMLGFQQTSSSNFEYLGLDCTNVVTLSFDMDISTLKAGMVFALYLTSFLQSNDPTDNAPYQSTDGSSYLAPTIIANLQGLKPAPAGQANGDPQWGVGYRDVQGLGCGSCIELDLMECTSSGIATTSHGIINPDSDPAQYDRGGSYMNGWESTGFYDPTTGQYTYQCNYDANNPNPNYGPGPQFKINTLRPISVTCTVDGTDPAALYMTTRLTQGANVLVLSPITYDGYASPLARLQLRNMQLVAALWATNTTSPATTAPNETAWWLDGINLNDANDIRSFAQCIPSSNTPNTLPFALPDDKVFYSTYASPAAYAVNYGISSVSTQYGPTFGRVQNLVVGCANPPSDPHLIGWSLDGYYRGVRTDADLNNWHGAYGNAYGIAIAAAADNVAISTYPSAATDPVAWAAVISKIGSTPPTQFAELSGFGSTDATLYQAQTLYPTITSVSPFNVLDARGGVSFTSNQTSTPVVRGGRFPTARRA